VWVFKDKKWGFFLKKIKIVDENSLNDIVNFGFSSILDKEYELENIKYKELEEIF